MAQYIADYEEQKFDTESNSKGDDKNLNLNMEALVMNNSSSPTPKKLKNFINSFGSVQHAKSMMMKLTNRTFIHSLGAASKNFTNFTRLANFMNSEKLAIFIADFVDSTKLVDFVDFIKLADFVDFAKFHGNIECDSFFYMSIEKYNVNECYDIMINTGAFKYSTIEYDQYLAFKKQNENRKF